MHLKEGTNPSNLNKLSVEFLKRPTESSSVGRPKCVVKQSAAIMAEFPLPLHHVKRAIIVAMSALCIYASVAYGQMADPASETPEIEQLKIGVLATEGSTRALEAWSPTIDFLNAQAELQEMPLRFLVSPQTQTSLLSAFEDGQLDLILADPATFVTAEVKHGARAILSMSRVWEDIALDRIGSLVFVRSDSTVRSFEQLDAKVLMAMSQNDFSGWRLAEQEFRKHRIDPDSHFENILFSGGNQREVIYAVQSGLVDAGIIGAGVMEDLASKGVLDLANFAPVSPISHPDFPFWVSTELYPEWVLSASSATDEPTLAFVINVLLTLRPDSVEATGLGNSVWQAPQNYQSVHELLISLRVPPYENYLLQAANRIYQHYRWPIWGGTSLIILSLVFLAYQVRRTARIAEERRNVLQSEIRSKQFYRNAIEDHTVFCMLSLDGMISHANAGFCNSTKHDKKSLINQPLADILTDRDRELLSTEIKSSMLAGSPWQGPLKILNGDGKYAWTQCTIIPVFSSGDQLSEVAIVASDVTKTRAGITQDSFNDSLELIDDQVVVLQPSTLKILYCNLAAETRLINDRTGGLWKNQPVSRFITEDDYEALKVRCEALVEGPQKRVTWEVTDKSETPYEVSLEYIQPEGSDPSFVAIYRDITQRKIAEKAKNDFIATVSHELRTPLTSIKGALGLALSGTIGEVPEQMGKMITSASTNCDRLVELVNDILDVQKMEAGKMDFNLQPLDVSELLAAALKSNQFYANKFGVTIRFEQQDSDIPYRTLGDYNRLMQVLDNLLSNASKFSENGSEIIIGLAIVGQKIRISIRDFGSGIPKAAQPSVFDKFHQADSTDTRSKGGTGLGLAITRKIIIEHSGSVTFVSEEGVGSEFFVKLPLLIGDELAEDEDTEDTQDEIVVFSKFSNPPQTSSQDYVRHLISVIERGGMKVVHEDGDLLTTQLASGMGTSGHSTILQAMNDETRSIIRELLDLDIIENRKVAVVKVSSETLGGAGLEDLISANTEAVRQWFTQLEPSQLDDQSDQQHQFKVLGVTNNIETKLSSDTVSWAGVDDAEMAVSLAAASPFDCFAHLNRSDSAFNIILLPTQDGGFPAEMPAFVITTQQKVETTERGVVSKFAYPSGAGRGKARRMRRAQG